MQLIAHAEKNPDDIPGDIVSAAKILLDEIVASQEQSGLSQERQKSSWGDPQIDNLSLGIVYQPI